MNDEDRLAMEAAWMDTTATAGDPYAGYSVSGKDKFVAGFEAALEHARAWKPVNERQPEKLNAYDVTFVNSEGIPEVGMSLWNGRWCSPNNLDVAFPLPITAWRERPEPYQEHNDQ